jgi:radical SAM superfamily enzyme YgiQ (UPF0313 family)
MDPIFNLHAERAKEICRFIAAHNSRRIPVHAEIWAEFVDDEMARLMREANFQFLEVGLQSTDESVLVTAERRLRLEKFLAGVRSLKTYGLTFELQLIYGLPGDTLASFRKSLNFAAALDPPQLAVFPLMVLPGTELWRKAAGLQLEFDPEPPYFVRSHYSMSAADVAVGWKLVEEINAVSRSKTLRYLGRERGLSYAAVIEAWMRWQEDEPGDELPGYRMKQFIVDFCDRNQIPSEFYRAFASWEYAG